MIKHITNINNIGGTASLAQESVTRIAHTLNFREIGLFNYNEIYDSDRDLTMRMDGIIAPVHHGDVVFFQYPSWNHYRYDEALIRHIRQFHNIKLVIWIEDVESLMFNSGLPSLMREISLFNQADLLIMPSVAMYEMLKENGLTQNNVLFQTVWDHLTDSVFTDHQPSKRIFFTGNYNRFPLLNDYHGTTPLYHYDFDKPSRENDSSFIWKGGKSPMKLLQSLSEGGFGLVWAEDDHFERYYSINQPHKLGFYLAAGIPVIVRKGCVHEDFVISNHLGYVAETLEEVDTLVQNTSDEEFANFYSSVASMQQLIVSGSFTSKLLQDAMIKLLAPSINI